MFASIVFFSALILLGVFIVLRLLEEKRGTRFIMPSVRASLDVYATRWYDLAVTGSIPAEYRARVLMFFRQTLHSVVVLIVAGLRAVERPLTRLSYKMRMAASHTGTKEVSSFLKTMGHRHGDAGVKEEK